MPTKTTAQRFLALITVVIGGLALAACSSQPATPPPPTPSPPVVVNTPTIAPTTPPTATPAPTIEPTPEAGLPITTLFLGAQVPVTATNFADIPGNLARGDVTPAFRANLMDRGPVTSADWRGGYLLLIPSVAGCGECMVNLFELTKVYSDYKNANLQVAFLSIYPGDKPDVWRPLAETFPDLPIQWGTIDPDFIVNYDIQGLGTVLLVDPQGKLVFRSDSPLQAESYQRLLALVEQPTEN